MHEEDDELNEEDAALISKEFRTSKPAFCEWKGLWKCHAEEDDVGKDDYEKIAVRFDHYCRKTYRRSPAYPDDFYIRADFTSDRTQVLEINNPEILKLEFLQEIQKWLTNSDNKNWRVLVPTYLTDEEIIIIYPSVIRISPKYEASLAEGVKNIASKMKKY